MPTTDRYRGDRHWKRAGHDLQALRGRDGAETKQVQRLALIRIAQLVSGEISMDDPRIRPIRQLANHPDVSDVRKLPFDVVEHDPGWRNLTSVRGAHLPERPREERPEPARFWIAFRLVPADPAGPDPRPALQVLRLGTRPTPPAQLIAARAPMAQVGPARTAAPARPTARRDSSVRQAASAAVQQQQARPGVQRSR
jgi:hypothetical protein